MAGHVDRARIKRVVTNPLFIVGVVVLLACSSGTKSGDSSGGGESKDVSAAASGPGTSKDNPAPLGTAIEVAKGWTVTVNSVNLDANAIMATENTFNTPASGKVFVIANVTVANGDDTPSSAFSNVTVKMLTPSGAALDTAFGVTPDALDVSTQLQPGGSLTGNLLYEVPAADVTGLLVLGEPLFTLDEVADQRFWKTTT